MTIEQKIFSRKRFCTAKLSEYGFEDKGVCCVLTRDMLDGDFTAEIRVYQNSSVQGRVIDKMSGDEYLPLRVEAATGAFVGTVRAAYESLLRDIADNCCTDVAFASDQSNRIAALILEKYGVEPDFPWDNGRYDTAGVFRHYNNNKWFALIMNIDRRLLGRKSGIDSTRGNTFKSESTSETSFIPGSSDDDLKTIKPSAQNSTASRFRGNGQTMANPTAGQSDCDEPVLVDPTAGQSDCDEPVLVNSAADQSAFAERDLTDSPGELSGEVSLVSESSDADAESDDFGTDIPVDVMNLKVDERKAPMLQRLPGIYPAYHMNHSKWISVVLDDTLTDGDVLDLVDESYRLTRTGGGVLNEKLIQEVLTMADSIPPGKVMSYGRIAAEIGRPKNSRLVGKIMSMADRYGEHPCHRVVNSAGRTVPGWKEQRAMLEAEGVTFKANGCVDMKKHSK